MTPDERLDRLTEKMEGLTNSVELLASFTKDNQQMVVSTSEDVRRISLAVEALAGRNSRLENLVAEIADAVAHLIPMARDHEHRIRSLEARQ